MIAAAAFGDVVEQSGKIKHFDTSELRNQPAAQRIFVRHLRHCEAAQVANHHQDVFVDGVDMKQVVLQRPTMRPKAGI